MPSCSAAAAVLLAILPNQNSAAAPGQKVQLRAVVRLAAHAAWVRSSPPTCTKSQPPPPHACTLQIEIRRGHPSKITETTRLCRSTPYLDGRAYTMQLITPLASAAMYGRERASTRPHAGWRDPDFGIGFGSSCSSQLFWGKNLPLLLALPHTHARLNVGPSGRRNSGEREIDRWNFRVF